MGSQKAFASVGADHADMGARSRFVKTQIRQFVDGDFVYLDADAIPLSAFDQVLRHATLGEKCHISAAIDRSPCRQPEADFPHSRKPRLTGWVGPDQHSFI
jgi:hypothetical protein